MIGAVTLNVGLNLLLIPRYDFYGAAVAWLITNVVWFAAGMIIACRLLKLAVADFYKIFRVLISGALMGLAIWFTASRLVFFWLIPSAALVYVVAIILTRAYETSARNT